MVREKCAFCNRLVSLFTNTGAFRMHGPRKSPCPGSLLSPGEADRQILHDVTEYQLAVMRESYRTGDWRPVELEFGIRFPQYTLHGVTPEEELAHLIDHCRNWLETIVQHSPVVDRRVP